ncbi:cytidylate kinase-like family protein [Alistipes sp. kh20]|uniref:cytidylate kinase-like family protein n=1 Tax=Alistipes TaxID=239759 RepID=UPI00189C3B62|nr:MULTISPECIES: cytidylate kinase-like family protein [Alistipes]MBS4766614.1 cytidylate kinase-like family protein [Alistipes montrealensis]
MEKFVINIGRQLGSGGKTVGEIIARRLGVRLYDKELINLAAEQSGLCPEVFEKADEKESRGVISTMIGYLRAPFVGDDGGTANVLSNDALFKIQSDVIREVAARESAVFVGRCADYILRENPRCVNVFITADDADRIERIRRRQGVSAEEARAVMERIDAKRASYYDYYSSRTWGVASTYHLCVSTSVLGDEGTADFILEFAARKLQTKF